MIAYDLIAFGLQPLIGWIQDRWATPRTMMTAGLGATVGSVALAQLTGTGLDLVAPAVILAGFGNAAFHLGAGSRVLRQDLDRAAPAGVFVAPGALGLGYGIWFGGTAAAGPTWLVAVPVVAALVIVTRLPAPVAASAHAPSGRSRPATEMVVGAVVLLLVSIGIRALVGGSAARGYSGTWLLIGLPLAAFAGKALGGLLADRFGWARTAVTALVVAAPLLAVTWPHPALLLAGLLVFQLTMPVTLVAVARLMPHRIATAFGLTCLALIIGSLPVVRSAVGDRPLIGGWVLLSAFAVWAGLTLSGLSWRTRPGRELHRAAEPIGAPG